MDIQCHEAKDKAEPVGIGQSFLAPLADLLRQLDEGDIPSKGEFVIIVAGADDAPDSAFAVDVLLQELAGKLSAKDAAKLAAKVTGEKRNDLYERILELRDRQ